MVVVMAFVSCTDNSPKGKIEKAFKDYVSKNFDDPKSLKEVTDIEFGTDTLNLRELRNLLKTEIEMAYSIDSVCSYALKMIMGSQDLSKTKAAISDKYREELMSMIKSMIDYATCKEDIGIELPLAKEKFDSIFTLDTIVVKDKIKCRVNKGGELRLETYTSSRDTNFESIVISTTNAKAEEVYDFYEESNRYLELSEKLSKLIRLGKEALYKFSEFDF